MARSLTLDGVANWVGTDHLSLGQIGNKGEMPVADAATSAADRVAVFAERIAGFGAARH